MRAAGVSVRHAMDGAAGLAMVNERPPDAMLLDIRMPGMGGIEVCRRLKSGPATAGFPVIFLTAETCDLTRQAALAAGGHCVIAKPYQAQRLIHAIQDACGSGRTPSDRNPIASTGTPGIGVPQDAITRWITPTP